MRIDVRLDAGAVLMRKEVVIEDGEHAPALFRRLAEIGAPVLVETIAACASGTAEAVAQDEALATLAPILGREDGWVDPTELAALEIDGRVRGFDPWPGVWLVRGKRRLRLIRVEPIDVRDFNADPGTLVGLRDGGVALACAGRSALRLIEVQPDGRAAIPVGDALNGRQIAVGDRLEPVRSR